MSNIYLVGFMGTGKSVVGRRLAQHKKWKFVDLDDLIELREKRRICDIFAKDGEPYFRRVERKALEEVAREKGFVVACGGGIVINPENLRTMKDSGQAICLMAGVDKILERTSGCSNRPLLNVSDPKKQVELLLKLRAPYYARADVQIDTSKLTVEQVVDKILKLALKDKQRPSVNLKVKNKKLKLNRKTKR